MQKRTRDFGGVTFKLAYDFSDGLSKFGAEQKAKQLREAGCLARVTYSNRYGDYEIWTRCRR